MNTQSCTPCCSTTQITEVPGGQGIDGGDGNDGQNAYTLTTLPFVIPAVGDTVTVSVQSSLWMALGQVLVTIGTYFKVITAPNATTATLENLGYSGGGPPGLTINAGSTLSPAGTSQIIMPCFAANLGGADQTGIVTATPTTLQFSNIVIDSHGDYDDTTYKFTPTIAGVYRFTVSVEVKAMADTKIVTVSLLKGGTIIANQKIQASSTTSAQASVNFLSQANGSTDYYTAQVTQDSGGNKDVDGSNTKTFFQGNWVGVAS